MTKRNRIIGSAIVSAIAIGTLVGVIWPQGRGEALRRDGLEIVYRTPEGLVAGSDMIVVADALSQHEERMNVDLDPSKGTRTDSVVTFKLVSVLRRPVGDSRLETIETRWTTERDVRIGSSGQWAHQQMDRPSFTAGDRYVLFLSPFLDADGSVRWGPSGSPSAGRVAEGGEITQLDRVGGEVADALGGLDLERLASLVHADDAARASVPTPAGPDDVVVPTRGLAFEQFAAHVKGLTAPDARALLTNLGLDSEIAGDPQFCVKVEAVAREWGDLNLSLGCIAAGK